MMQYVPIGDLEKYLDKDVSIAGWVKSVRNQKNVQFVIIRDNTGVVQTVNPKLGNDLDDTIHRLLPESTVYANGRIVRDDRIKLRQLEMRLDSITLLSSPVGPLPINETSSLDSRLDWRFLDLRNPKKRSIFQVQTSIESAMRAYWASKGFIEIHSPKLVEGASESGAELFQLEYFGKTASLAQSPQFYKQMAMAAGFDRVFEIGPVFRANPSFTSRHDTEFTSVDVEMSWIDSHHDVIEFEENWLQYILGEVYARHGKEIKDVFGIDVVIPRTPFPRISMREAYGILDRMGYRIPRETKGDLDPEGERKLSQYMKEQTGHEFVFVTDYPVGVRPFYHMRHSNAPDITKSFDLLWKGLEVTTGAQREHRYTKLVEQAVEKGVDIDAISHYLDFFKYGVPPHGGFGFGLTRMLMQMLELPNVREVTYLYRGPNRLSP